MEPLVGRGESPQPPTRRQTQPWAARDFPAGLVGGPGYFAGCSCARAFLNLCPGLLQHSSSVAAPLVASLPQPLCFRGCCLTPSGQPPPSRLGRLLLFQQLLGQLLLSLRLLCLVETSLGFVLRTRLASQKNGIGALLRAAPGVLVRKYPTETSLE